MMGVHLSYAEQYGTRCITIERESLISMQLEPNLATEELMTLADHNGATYDDEPGSTCYVIQFPDRPQELYTESALRRSLKVKTGGRDGK